MFRNLRGKLAVVNASTLLLVLLVLGVVLYSHIHFRLYQDMDEILRLSESRIRTITNIDELLRSDFRELQEDERTVYLYWNRNGELTGQLPEQSFSPQEARLFQPNHDQSALRTIASDLRRFRILQIACGESNCKSSNPIDTITVVRSLNDVEGMLSALKRDLAAGIAIGLVLSIAGGYYLAGRALIPIRRSWDKQNRFVADASHELRTPTTIIHAQAEMLLRRPYHTIEQESPNISNILRESKRMGKLVDDLLTLARIDSQDMKLQGGLFQLDSLGREIAEQFRLIAETKQIDLHTNVQGSIVLWGDENRIRQLLLILLDNAYKFTPHAGAIELSIFRTSHAVHLRVSDNGCGIASEDMPHLFERFYRGDKARSRATTGTGLGLSIAEWIVKSHEGKIRIHSVQGTGTTVEVSFPMTRTRTQ
ncbi:sensor histidine kinase [Cohnella terricola]|uniref:histidine kinase n=1 Tax=Cohnella terricola TaxID=1289167 RepID=A0A559JQB6_9BACL|nr:ATP-binding protein [Cohnella terricola]TVY02047.1 hypothetical protein FPZ45_06290 [Cohnella terricola]